MAGLRGIMYWYALRKVLLLTHSQKVIIRKAHHYPLSPFLLRVSSVAVLWFLYSGYSDSYRSLSDKALVDELLSLSTFRFWPTGADNHCISPEEVEDFDVSSPPSVCLQLYSL